VFNIAYNKLCVKGITTGNSMDVTPITSNGLQGRE